MKWTRLIKHWSQKNGSFSALYINLVVEKKMLPMLAEIGGVVSAQIPTERVR